MKKRSLVLENFIPSSVWPILIGLFAFLFIPGPLVLNPTNIAWLEHGDPAQHFLGWQMFRNSPWTFPLGANPNYGLDLSNSIVYSDSNPLFAIIFKFFSPLLPDVFQYFGLWLLICYTLQAYFAWKLIALFSTSKYISAFGSILFVFAPPLMLRTPGHLSLSGHFLILAALYLCFRPHQKNRITLWACLVGVTALVHAYFIPMVGILWLSDLCWQRYKKAIDNKTTFIEIAVVFASLAITTWQAGYFTVSGGVSAGGYGFYRMNIISLFNSCNSWSYILTGFNTEPGEFEGFNYLGLGGVILFILSIPALLNRSISISDTIKKRSFLFLALLFLAVFAISNNIGIGNYSFSYPLPSFIEKIANIFRASGRLFWPVFYSILLASIFLLSKSNKVHTAIVILGLASIVQVLDTNKVRMEIRQVLMVQPATTWTTKLKDPFWAEASRKYKKLKILLPMNTNPNWQTFAAYSAMNGLGTDSVYLARIDDKNLEKTRYKSFEMLKNGGYENDTLYIVDPEHVELAYRSIRAGDSIIQADGFTIVAPSWKEKI
ncbi:DUF6311 domain-containing protein [Pseudomonas luteola]|uniref:DUF6311 domain-containing protein n=1 Tax=Pseudomonas luteola TaxID=47886 RepID=UPI001EF62045|nr:DUF6311 domain-containing protein [Pseudomonas luteola]MCG7375261.1 DUF6311 domain-containing protein [Pseudomonas luteola]